MKKNISSPLNLWLRAADLLTFCDQLVVSWPAKNKMWTKTYLRGIAQNQCEKGSNRWKELEGFTQSNNYQFVRFRI